MTSEAPRRRGRPKGSKDKTPRKGTPRPGTGRKADARLPVARLRAARPGDVLWFAESLQRIDGDARRVGVRVKVERWIVVRPETLTAERLTRAEVQYGEG